MAVTLENLQEAARTGKDLFALTEAKKNEFATSKMDSVAFQDRIVEQYIRHLDVKELRELREGLKNADLKDLMLGHHMAVKEALDITGYPVLLKSGIKQALYKGYALPETHFEKLVTKEDSTKREEEYGGLNETDMPEEVLPGKPYPESALGEKSAKIKNAKYGRIIALDIELAWHDQQNKIMSKARSLGRGARLHQEQNTFNAIMDPNSDVYRPGGVAGALYTAGRTNLRTSATLATAAQEAAIAAFKKFTDDKGNPILSIPDTQIVPEVLEGTANRIMKASSYAGDATYAHDQYNWLKDRYGSKWLIVSSPFVDMVSTTNWFIMSRQLGMLIYQEVKPITLSEQPDNSHNMFHKDQMEFRVMLYYKVAPIDWRAFMKCTP